MPVKELREFQIEKMMPAKTQSVKAPEKAGES